ncbi:hypothetical protein DFJ74DRAFT_691177, partial [Hyaloraphidium curvatum]
SAAAPATSVSAKGPPVRPTPAERHDAHLLRLRYAQHHEFRRAPRHCHRLRLHRRHSRVRQPFADQRRPGHCDQLAGFPHVPHVDAARVRQPHRQPGAPRGIALHRRDVQSPIVVAGFEGFVQGRLLRRLQVYNRDRAWVGGLFDDRSQPVPRCGLRDPDDPNHRGPCHGLLLRHRGPAGRHGIAKLRPDPPPSHGPLRQGGQPQSGAQRHARPPLGPGHPPGPREHSQPGSAGEPLRGAGNGKLDADGVRPGQRHCGANLAVVPLLQRRQPLMEATGHLDLSVSRRAA